VNILKKEFLLISLVILAAFVVTSCNTQTGLKESMPLKDKALGIAKQPDTTNFTCVDTDNGKFYYVKGKVKYKGQTYWDTCVNTTGTTKLQEHYCYQQGGNWKHGVKMYTCPGGCSNGACIPSTCTDSDGGIVYYTKGKVTYNGQTFWDSCISNTQLEEHYCDIQGNNVEHGISTHTCSYMCSNGACVNQTTNQTEGLTLTMSKSYNCDMNESSNYSNKECITFSTDNKDFEIGTEDTDKIYALKQDSIPWDLWYDDVDGIKTNSASATFKVMYDLTNLKISHLSQTTGNDTATATINIDSSSNCDMNDTVGNRECIIYSANYNYFNIDSVNTDKIYALDYNSTTWDLWYEGTDGIVDANATTFKINYDYAEMKAEKA
jgi:hypothetical protein